MAKSLYKTLEVAENATIAEIKKQYRILAKKYHPDLNKSPEAEDKFKEINAAYEVLGDKTRKAEYDQYGDNIFGGQNFHDFSQSQKASYGDMDLNDILKNMFNKKRTGEDFGFGGGQGFDPFTSRGYSGNKGFSNKDLDIESSLNIDFRTSIIGGTKTISMQNENISIKIPQGVRTGQKLRIKGKGRIYSGQNRGDLYITLNVLEDEEYKRNGNDLSLTINISLKDAIFGGKVNVKTLYKDVLLSIPKNTKQNQRFKIKDQGVLANQSTKEYGSLIVTVNVVIPKMEDLSKELQEMLIKEL
jgi:curved DNA-binding protein